MTPCWKWLEVNVSGHLACLVVNLAGQCLMDTFKSGRQNCRDDHSLVDIGKRWSSEQSWIASVVKYTWTSNMRDDDGRSVVNGQQKLKQSDLRQWPLVDNGCLSSNELHVLPQPEAFLSIVIHIPWRSNAAGKHVPFKVAQFLGMIEIFRHTLESC